MQEIKHLRILITGAGGWIGKEVLCLLQSSFGSLHALDLTLTGSFSRSIDIHGERIQIISSSDAYLSNRFDLVIHLAFITQEKLAALGADEYVRANTRLNDHALSILENNSAAHHLVLSSGVASFYTANGLSSKNIYAGLKLDLEKKMHGEKSLILRLWNTSGHHLGRNSNYALSEFITLAKNNRPISIKRNVSRSYISAQDVLCASLKYVLAGGIGTINSGGFETDLLSLANSVVRVNHSQSNIVCLDLRPTSSENYVSPVSEIPQKYWLGNSDLEEQIRETTLGIT